MKAGVFEEATMDFLIVGHTGNEVDQLFSILTNEFKTEIPTVEALKQKILNAPIIPKPVVEHLFYIWNWKKFIEKELHPLEFHSFFNSFQLKMEENEVRFRYKRLPQDLEYGPKAGMKLVKFGVQSRLIDVADFRIESLQLEKLFRSLEAFFQTLPLYVRMDVKSKWQALRKTLEALPMKQESMCKMDISSLTGHSVEPAQPEINLPNHAEPREIEGEFYEELVDEGEFETEASKGMDVCVYTTSKIKRPWVGRIVEVKKEMAVVIHWYEKRKGSRSGEYVAMKHDDGTPYLSEQDMKSVMFWAFTFDKSPDSFSISPYWQSTLKREYDKLDQ